VKVVLRATASPRMETEPPQTWQNQPPTDDWQM